MRAFVHRFTIHRKMIVLVVPLHTKKFNREEAFLSRRSTAPRCTSTEKERVSAGGREKERGVVAE